MFTACKTSSLWVFHSGKVLIDNIIKFTRPDLEVQEDFFLPPFFPPYPPPYSTLTLCPLTFTFFCLPKSSHYQICRFLIFFPNSCLEFELVNEDLERRRRKSEVEEEEVEEEEEEEAEKEEE